LIFCNIFFKESIKYQKKFDIKVPDSIIESSPEGWSTEEFEKLFGKEIPN
jgi:hypothetical protein